MKLNLGYESKRVLEDLGLQIDEVMRERKVTVNELAERTKFDPHYVRRILRGEEDLPLKDLVDIGFALGCRWDTVVLRKGATP